MIKKILINILFASLTIIAIVNGIYLVMSKFSQLPTLFVFYNWMILIVCIAGLICIILIQKSKKTKKIWTNILIVILALMASGLSLPLYFFTMLGLAMSDGGRSHINFLSACFLLAFPIVCIAAIIYILKIQKSVKWWLWVLTIPLMLLSGIEIVGTLWFLLN